MICRSRSRSPSIQTPGSMRTSNVTPLAATDGRIFSTASVASDDKSILTHRPFLQHDGIPEDGVQRRSQLVGQRREKLILLTAGFIRGLPQAELLGDVARNLRCPDDRPVRTVNG